MAQTKDGLRFIFRNGEETAVKIPELISLRDTVKLAGLTHRYKEFIKDGFNITSDKHIFAAIIFNRKKFHNNFFILRVRDDRKHHETGTG